MRTPAASTAHLQSLHILTLKCNLEQEPAKLPASVAQWAEAQCVPTRTVCRRSRGSIPGSAGRFRVRISGAHALRLISRAGKRGFDSVLYNL